jgi:hypothetical protein
MTTPPAGKKPLAETLAPGAEAPAASAPKPAAPTAGPVTAETIDGRGRIIKLRALNALDRMRLFKLLGPDGAPNQMLLGYATLAVAVVAIDGVDQAWPANERQLEALVGKLDEDGLGAVAMAYKENFGVPEAEFDKDAIKNS